MGVGSSKAKRDKDKHHDNANEEEIIVLNSTATSALVPPKNRKKNEKNKDNYGSVFNYTSANLNEYNIKPSSGCWIGWFSTKQNLFLESNWTGMKPDVTQLSHSSPSFGCWFGSFCRKMVPKKNKNNSKDIKKKVKPRSTMVCDGGGWYHSEGQRTVFKVVVQDEITKGAPNNTKNDTQKNSDSHSTTNKSVSGMKALVPKTVRKSMGMSVD